MGYAMVQRSVIAAMIEQASSVTPTKVGPRLPRDHGLPVWVPAFAGMTMVEASARLSVD